MIAWLVGDDPNAPRRVVQIAPSGAVNEIRNWAARRALYDPELDDNAFHLMIEHSPWDGKWWPDDIPELLAQLEQMERLAAEQVRYTPGSEWMVTVLRRCLTAARAANAVGEAITIR